MEFIIVAAAVVFLIRLLNGSGAKYRFDQVDDRELQEARTDNDFDDRRKLKKTVAQVLANYKCPRCGNHKVRGAGVIVRYGKVHLCRREPRKGWFGATKYHDVRYATVWRVHEIGLRNAPGRALLNFFGLLDPPPGSLECHAKGCGWAERGGRGGTLSLGHVMSGKWS